MSKESKEEVSLNDVLNSTQIDLLTKTLQLEQNIIKPKINNNAIKWEGLCPELKLTNSFTASFTSVDKEEFLLNCMSQKHEVFTGIGKQECLIEIGRVNLRSKDVRKKHWDNCAAKIQSCWRGMRCRELLLS